MPKHEESENWFFILNIILIFWKKTRQKFLVESYLERDESVWKLRKSPMKLVGSINRKRVFVHAQAWGSRKFCFFIIQLQLISSKKLKIILVESDLKRDEGIWKLRKFPMKLVGFINRKRVSVHAQAWRIRKIVFSLLKL